MPEDNSALQEFAKLIQDPEKLAALKRKVAWEGFKEKYNIERASPLKCPACGEAGFVGGTLYFKKEPKNECICRKCLLEWRIDCITLPVEELMLKMKEASK